MYLKGEMTIDPSQLTEIIRIEPTHGFARVAHFLTLGLASDQEERETFCAVTILQQLYKVLRSIGIDNIVRLAKDDTVFFEDHKHQPNDLKQALDEFARRTPPAEAKVFETLELLLEHATEQMSYLIEIWIVRRHSVGTHPIQITVNGMPQQLAAAEEDSKLQAALEDIFASQLSYNEFVATQKLVFADFLDQLKRAMEIHMQVDQVTVESEVKIVRPDGRGSDRNLSALSARDRSVDPVFHGDYGTSDAFLYAWLWSDLCHHHDIHCRDCVIVDSQGQDQVQIGPEGFQAGADDLLNVDVPFLRAMATETATSTKDSTGIAEVSEDTFKNLSNLNTSGGDSGGGWLSSFFGGSSCGSSCGSDGGSSCGSSCGGGGCGGGGCGGGD